MQSFSQTDRRKSSVAILVKVWKAYSSLVGWRAEGLSSNRLRRWTFLVHFPQVIPTLTYHPRRECVDLPKEIPCSRKCPPPDD